MVFRVEDRLLIKNLFECNGYGAKKLVKEFPGKDWRVRSVNKLSKRFREYGITDWQPGSGRPKTARTSEKIEALDYLIFSQDGAPQTHRTTHQIFRETGIHRSSVSRIVHKDLRLKCLKKKRRAQELSAANRVMRLVRSRQLLRRFPAAAADFIFFNDDKCLHGRATRRPTE